MNNIDEIKKKFKEKLISNENLSKYSWFNLGGNAELFFRPESKIELINFLKTIKPNQNDVFIIGAGSNTLIRDGGVKGITIKLSSKFSFLNLVGDEIIEVGASTLDRKLAEFAKEKSIGGFEFLSCIPGSVGGALIMNSGCYNEQISETFISCNIVDFNGNEKVLTKDDINFFYRGSTIPKNYIIISAKFRGTKKDKNTIAKKQTEFINKKKLTQPSNVKTCGSTFKNPLNKKAWQLIKESNCEDFFVGEARISSKHCNFFVNEGSASSKDIEELVNKVKQKVLDTTGINLELEIKIKGEK